MPRNKRKISPQPSLIAKKRVRRVVTPEPSNVIFISSSPTQEQTYIPNTVDSDVEFIDEDFEVVLAQIDKLEGRNGRHATKAGQHTSKSASGSGSGAQTTAYDVDQYEVIDLDSDSQYTGPESDEALAKRLAAQWEAEDVDMDIEEPEPGSPIPTAVKPTRNSPQDPPHARSIEQNPRSTLKHVSTPELKIPYIALFNPEDKLQNLKVLLTSDRPCSKCRKLISPPRGHVMFTSQSTTLPPSLTTLLHSPCASCKINHCRGCFTPVTCPVSCRGPSKNPSCSIANCCAEGRAVALFEALGGFDRQYLAEKATSDSRAQSNLVNMKVVGSVGPGGTGYGTGSVRGRGRGRGRGRSAATSQPTGSSSASHIQDSAEHWESIVIRAFKSLTYLLPSPYTDSPEIYDMLPHSSIGPLLLMSHIPVILANLLRNDSVTDWIACSETYYAMLALLRRMADCELTLQVLIGHRQEIASSLGLENWMWDEGEILWTVDKEGKKELAPPLLEHFKKLARQSEAFIAGASQMMTGPSDGDEEGEEERAFVEGASLCGDIIAAKGDLERAMKIIGDLSISDGANTKEDIDTGHPTRSTANGQSGNSHTAKGKGKGKAKAKAKSKSTSQIELSAFDIEKEYIAACEKLSFDHVPFLEDTDEPASGKGKGKGPVPGSKYSNYNYAQMLTDTQNSTRLPKDRLHLVKELAVMATSLPPGIWVRVDETRNDAIKIMIAGPQGTPYAGGLFEFDCFMPIQYPKTPPLVHLRTTGGGSVRFNPNLYNCGKVCLSLLGTWAGAPEEQWSPAKSTLLQVLVSIQSMILNEAPYYNEPGHGKADVKSTASIQYNREIFFQTVRWAIVDWLKEENINGIWRDIIKSHFTICKDKIRQQILEWSTVEPRIRSFHNQYGRSIQAQPMQTMAHAVGPFGPLVSGSEFPSSWDPYHNVIAMPNSKISSVKQPQLLPNPETIDFLKKFDEGMEIVEGWATEEE